MYKRIILFIILFLLFSVPSAFGKANLANITVKNVDNYTDVIFNLNEGISYTDFRMDNKVVVLGMKTDKMHTSQLSKQIHNRIKNSEYFEMETNRDTHNATMTRFVRKYLKIDESNQ